MFNYLDKLRKNLRRRENDRFDCFRLNNRHHLFVWISTFWLSSASNEPKKDSFSEIITPLASIKENIAGAYSSFVKIIGVGQKVSEVL